MSVCVPCAMSPGLSVSIAEVAAMSDSVFHKRFRSFYNSSPSPTFLGRKRYRGTSELISDIDSDWDELTEEVEESLDLDSKSEDVEDEGPSANDEDPAAGDEGLTTRDEGPNMGVESLRIEGDEAVPEGQQRVFEVGQSFGFVPESERLKRVSALRHPTLTTWIDPEDGIAYIDVPTYRPAAPPIQIPPSPKWTSGSFLISLTPSIIPSPISSPMISLIIPSVIATPATAEIEGFLTELGAQVEMLGGLIRDHTLRLGELSPGLFE
nr:hypothetical protein [Tanacetum cinerariifolium]